MPMYNQYKPLFVLFCPPLPAPAPHPPNTDNPLPHCDMNNMETENSLEQEASVKYLAHFWAL